MKLSQRDLKTVAAFCGEEYAKRYRALRERQKNDKVRIVNTGMVSSGKSSLYNALIDSSEEYFPTGAARTTTRADYFDCGPVSYVDTPGIDVRSEDDALAFDTLMEADRILMIHNIRTGPLNRSEALWLERIARGLAHSGRERFASPNPGSTAAPARGTDHTVNRDFLALLTDSLVNGDDRGEHFLTSLNAMFENKDERKSEERPGDSRMIFVLSWIDTREKEEDYGALVENVKKQVFEIVGGEIPFFEVSVKKYRQGIEKGREILVKNSGVQALKEYLESSAAAYLEMKQDEDQRELAALTKEIRSILCEQRDERKREKREILKKARKRHQSRRSAWNVVYDYFSAQRKRLTDLEKERERIETAGGLYIWRS